MKNKQDVLNRQEFIERVCNIVNVISKSGTGCCFAIDGVWGSGKSFILERIEEKLKVTQSEETNAERYLVFHYDCWKYDYYEEPIIAIIAAMLDATEREFRVLPEGAEDAINLSWNTVKATLIEIVKELCKNKIGINLVEVAQNVLEQNDKSHDISFDEMYGFRKALEKTREGIQKIAKEKTIVILVDELDRCLPTYTIKVLERLHHIFADIENVIVIIAMDKKQIEHMVEQIYGVSGIDVDRYLRKFVSFELSLEKGKASDYLSKYSSFVSLFDVKNEEREEIDTFLSNIMTGVDIRTQEKIFNKAEIIYGLVCDNKIVDSSILVFEILMLVLYEKKRKPI
ncbi:MAG: KAP family NTPase [Clostridiales bacterium]|nr:KAP family NTPase [Clostridiales bacterium]